MICSTNSTPDVTVRKYHSRRSIRPPLKRLAFAPEPLTMGSAAVAVVAAAEEDAVEEEEEEEHTTRDEPAAAAWTAHGHAFEPHTPTGGADCCRA